MDQLLSVKDEVRQRKREKLERELGPLLLEWLQDPAVIEIMLNPDGSLWVERLGSPMELGGRMSGSQAEALIGSVAAAHDLVVNEESAILECELPLDGSRFQAQIPPITLAPMFNIRKHAIAVFTLEDYLEKGILTEGQYRRIERAIIERENILIVGGTGSGKTTLGNAVLRGMARLTPDHRFCIVEDTRELQCKAKNFAAMKTDRIAGITMNDLVRALMRSRPDRIIVGEVRGGEALELLKAWNTGHPGGLATIHANGAEKALYRLDDLIAEVSKQPLPRLVAEAVNVIVFIKKTATSRKIEEIVSVRGYEDGKYIVEPEL